MPYLASKLRQASLRALASNVAYDMIVKPVEYRRHQSHAYPSMCLLMGDCEFLQTTLRDVGSGRCGSAQWRWSRSEYRRLTTRRCSTLER